MAWRKLGRIFGADGHSEWMHSHAMIPIAEQLDRDLHRIYFSPRDKLNRGHGAYLEIDMRDPLRVVRLHSEPVLEPGELGCFDDSGALPHSIVNFSGRKRLYYTGINLGVTVPIRNAIGVAEWDIEEGRFKRLFDGPIIDRTAMLPHFVATPEVKFNKKFFAWFSTCQRWVPTLDGPRHYYNIEYAESSDGITWFRPGTVPVDFISPFEYAITSPRIFAEGQILRMLFCSRATESISTYRIHSAESADGKHWTRRDSGFGLDVSESGWDSEMVCYPFVFEFNGDRYMLYNGNGYGRTGFGIAIFDA